MNWNQQTQVVGAFKTKQIIFWINLLVVMMGLTTHHVSAAEGQTAVLAGASTLLDPTFDSDGVQTTSFGGFDEGFDVALQADGGIVMIGQGAFNLALARFTSDGSLDTSFDGDGKLTDGRFGEGRAVAVQADGKIVAAGAVFPNALAVARYDADGSDDSSFGSSGMVTTSIGGFAHAYSLAIQADGKIVVVGDNGDFAIARYTSSGVLDTTFDSDGVQTTHIKNSDKANDVAIQSDGSIVVVGRSADATGAGTDAVIVRYTSSGALDSTFDSDGIQSLDNEPDDVWQAVALQDNGKIVAVGTDGADFVIGRYTTTGSLDSSFDSDGLQILNLGSIDEAYDVVIQPDAKILVVGSTDGHTIKLIRLNSDGSLDNTFGSGGIISLQINGNSSQASGLALQSDGKIVVAGDSNNDFAVARYVVSCSQSAATEAELNAAITCFNTEATSGTHTITLTADISLTAHTTAISNNTSAMLQLDGADYTLDGVSSYRPLMIAAGNVSIANMTLQNGNAPFGCPPGTHPTDQERCGGAINILSNATVVLTNVTVLNSQAFTGGGLHNGGGNVTINNSTFSNNLGYYYGAIANRLNGIMTINNSTISHNNSYLNAGIDNHNATLTVNASTIVANVASGAGGGIGVLGGGMVTVSNSTIANNTAQASAGAYITGDAAMHIVNSTIANNSSMDGAGGLHSSNENLTLKNTLIVDNSDSNCFISTATQVDDTNMASDGSCGNAQESNNIALGILRDNGGSTLTHILLPHSDAVDAGDNAICAASPVNNVDQRGVARPQSSKCDIGAVEYQEVPEPVIYSTATAVVWENETFAIDVNAFDDEDEEGDGLRFSLRGLDGGHFTIDQDTGEITFNPAPDFEAPTDVGGNNIYDIVVVVEDSDDLMAVQTIKITVVDIAECAPFPLSVTTTEELSMAIDCFNYFKSGSHTINIAADITLSGTLTAVNNPLGASLEIDGNGHVLDGNNTYRLFTIQAGNIEMKNTTLQNGAGANDCANITPCGGAILVEMDAVARLTELSIMNNNAYSGGGVLNIGNLTIEETTFSNNIGTNGGGVANSGTLSVKETTFTHNQASYGAGLLNTGTLEATNVTFSANLATTWGGGLYNYGNATINNATFSANGANEGGGFYRFPDPNFSFSVTNSLIANSSSGANCSGADAATVGTSNLDSDGSCGDAVSSASINLGSLQDNGGKTWTHALLAGSVAIDAGNDNSCANNDQRGTSRPQGSSCDIGAFEVVGQAVAQPALNMLANGSFDWTPVQSQCTESLYRSEAPFAGYSWLTDDPANYMDASSLTQIDPNYFYYLHVDCGDATVDSNKTGEFTFAIVPGN